MKTYKARSPGPKDPTPNLLIEATEEIPACTGDALSSGAWRQNLRDEAKKIVDAMYASLPCIMFSRKWRSGARVNWRWRLRRDFD